MRGQSGRALTKKENEKNSAIIKIAGNIAGKGHCPCWDCAKYLRALAYCTFRGKRRKDYMCFKQREDT